MIKMELNIIKYNIIKSRKIQIEPKIASMMKWDGMFGDTWSGYPDETIVLSSLREWFQRFPRSYTDYYGRIAPFFVKIKHSCRGWQTAKVLILFHNEGSFFAETAQLPYDVFANDVKEHCVHKFEMHPTLLIAEFQKESDAAFFYLKYSK